MEKKLRTKVFKRKLFSELLRYHFFQISPTWNKCPRCKFHMDVVSGAFATSLLPEMEKSAQNGGFHMEISRAFATSLLSYYLEMEKGFKTQVFICIASTAFTTSLCSEHPEMQKAIKM